MSPVKRIRQSIWGLAIGTSVTAGVVILNASGVFERFELDMVDWRFERFNRIPPSDLILHVDITDDALERIHRWPWPRRLHADLISTLRELGARSVVMDVAFAEDQQPRLPLPNAGSTKRIAEKLSRSTVDDVIFDDQVLCGAIAHAGNVYLPMFYESIRQGGPKLQLERWLRDQLRQDRNVRTDRLLERARAQRAFGDIGPDVMPALCRRTHLEVLLESRFALRVDELSEMTGIDSDDVDKILPGIKKGVARRLAQQALERTPDLPEDQFVREILPDASRDSLDVADARAAYKTEQAIRAALRGTAPIPSERQWLYPAVRSITPALASLGRAARATGFVTYESSSRDGVLREIPLVTCYRGRMLRQLAFTALCDVLDVPSSNVEIVRPGRLILRDARCPGETERRDVVVPLNEYGEFLLNWYADRERYATYRDAEQWRSSFQHIAVGRVLEIPQNRRALQDGRQRARGAAVAFTTSGSAASAYKQYLDLARARQNLERALQSASLGNPASSQPASLPAQRRKLADITKRMAEMEENAIAVIRSAYEQIANLEPENDQERRDFQQIRQIARRLDHLDRLERRISDRAAELGPIVNGKVCFVGYTATAVADFITTPLFDPAPGVVAHANLLHTLYSGAMIRRAPEWSAVLMIFLCGLATTAITTWRGPIFSLLTAAVGLNVVIVAGALALFYLWRIWVIVPAVVAAVLASWALITVYRQLTEGRDKRLAFGRLGQYTSPTLARRLAEDPKALSRAEAREVTCYFSDLKGFTTISEGLGAERTQALLNVYFERMSEVLDRHEAFVNKFLGDGIFAFFNPAVNPQPDHVRLACEAALDTIAALDDLIGEQRARGGDEAFQRLRCRVGLATGMAVVGNCGSDRKFDYTCIGDTVNLAARLESANKAFGTKIMVAETTRSASGDGYDWRYLGGLRVVGKDQPVAVYEILGRKGTARDEEIEYAERFEQGVRLFEQRKWVDCVTHFARMLARRPDDPGLMLYMDRCQEYDKYGAPEGWSGEIELTEK